MNKISGSIVAIVTPFLDDKIDEVALRNLVEFHIANGTDGIVPCGTTGESATLSHDEHFNVVEIVIDQVKGRIPVIAGAGSNSTTETILLTEHAKKCGADAALLITPYYNKPTQDGLYMHYKTVADRVDIPIILYNVPSRTAINMCSDTVIRLSKIDNIVGIKEASGSIDQITEIIRNTDDSFTMLSGEDYLFYPILALGGDGVISVSTNVVPDLMSKLYDTFISRDYNQSKDIHYKLLDLFKVLFSETNPIPVKYALYLQGMISDELRLPLLKMSSDNIDRLKKVLIDLGIDLSNKKR